jgi:hypothetical protein
VCYIKGMAKVGWLRCEEGEEVLVVDLMVEWIKCSTHRAKVISTRVDCRYQSVREVLTHVTNLCWCNHFCISSRVYLCMHAHVFHCYDSLRTVQPIFICRQVLY